MSTSIFSFEQRNLRSTDTNSLLRMYDSANEFFNKTPSQLERTKTNRAIQRIVKELQRRHVPL